MKSFSLFHLHIARNKKVVHRHIAKNKKEENITWTNWPPAEEPTHDTHKKSAKMKHVSPEQKAKILEFSRDSQEKGTKRR